MIYQRFSARIEDGPGGASTPLVPGLTTKKEDRWLMTDSRPQRIQRRRTPGWRMPADAVYVGRPTKWGNPWTVAEWRELMARLHHSFTDAVLTRTELDREARDVATTCFYSAMVDRLDDPDYLDHEHPGWYPPLEQVREELAGKDLACWCQPAAQHPRSREQTMTACRLFPPEYDTSRHCGEHGGIAWLHGPNSNLCDRAPHPCSDPQCPDWQSGLTTMTDRNG